MLTHRLSARIAAAALAALIAVNAAAHAQPSPQPQGPRYIKSERVNVRGGPGTGNSVLEVLLLGAEVQIYAVTGDWARISPPGKPEKWVYAPLLQPEKPQARPAKAAAKPAQQSKGHLEKASQKQESGPGESRKDNPAPLNKTGPSR
ncbi:MAG: hypothetical protein CVT79_12880 [Alphaproteobacteria bacterium HGW-Alphaproteobacteria-18]|nr:MAG: hypothetical protein CVT79_12880 [Alphaproteobacteria bacterium HGW-Alphaproteobacteria-18]